jgi:hypothetical protein
MQIVLLIFKHFNYMKILLLIICLFVSTKAKTQDNIYWLESNFKSTLQDKNYDTFLNKADNLYSKATNNKEKKQIENIITFYKMLMGKTISLSICEYEEVSYLYQPNQSSFLNEDMVLIEYKVGNNYAYLIKNNSKKTGFRYFLSMKTKNKSSSITAGITCYEVVGLFMIPYKYKPNKFRIDSIFGEGICPCGLRNYNY